ncbi:MAG TPA: AAA family ATPase [Candidatus Limnocylindrales bacterium]|nr:AAA family ATPase [Candidatus Limnocylindrales bacterium]
MARRVSSPIFVGRVAERAALSEALERAAAGRPGIVLVSGEAGIGKSRLLHELTTLGASMAVTSVMGACVDVAAGTLPFGPFVDIVRELNRERLVASAPARTRAELGRLVPELAPERREEPSAAAGGQGRLFAAVRDLLAVASATNPIVVAIEDLHWADLSTLDLVTYLARSMQTEHWLLVATARLDSLPRRHPLLGVVAELARLPWLERIDLDRFDEGELVQQLTGILGRAPDPELAREVFERSDGNAFFAEELVATGARAGPLPASLREALAGRLAALDDEAKHIVRVAAVAGRVVSHELLERVAATPSQVLIPALHQAIDHRILLRVDDPAPGYAFRHALVREAAYDELLTAERIAIHRAIADALEGDAALAPPGELARTGEIAHHAMAARDLSRALSASVVAAAVAEEASAHAEAEAHLERIVDIWPRVPDASSRSGMDHAQLLARMARAAAAAGHQARAISLAGDALAELDAEDDGDRRLGILLERFDYAWEAADIGTAEEVVLEALPLVRDERSARGARAFAAEALLHWHHGRYTNARQSASRAIAIARGGGTRHELARALMILAQADTHLGETNRAEAGFTEAAAIVDEVGDSNLRARLTRWRAWGRHLHGRFSDALDLCRVGLEAARREGSDGRYGLALLDGSLENLVELGRWREAEAVGDQILGRMAVALEMVGTHMTLARLHTLQGRHAEAEHRIAQAGDVGATIGPHLLWQLEDAILLAYASGRFADGRRLMDTALAASPEPGRDAILWWPLLKAVGGEADHAEAARRRRRTIDVDQAIAAGQRFAAALRASGDAAIEADGGGPMIRAGLLGAEAEASRLVGRSDATLWEAVVEARDALEQPWEAAYARYRLAEAILAGGGPSADAAGPLCEAHAVASSLGAAPLRTSLETLASRARIQLQEPPASAVTAAPKAETTLTSRELEVLGLVAAGHTNREIGERLFISEKTASVHVTHAMDKLGALSRYEAAATATRLGLLGT